MLLPFMVLDEDVKQVITQWLPTWKLGFEHPPRNVEALGNASGKSTGTTTTENTPPTQHPHRAITSTTGEPPDIIVGSTKRTIEPVKGARKKNRAQHQERDETITLMEGDLEKIVDAVTLSTEERWEALAEQQKLAIYIIQNELHTLQSKTDDAQTRVTRGWDPSPSSEPDLVMGESHLCKIPSGALIMEDQVPATQIPARTRVQLNLTQLSHEVVHDLHIVVCHEIHHQNQHVSQ